MSKQSPALQLLAERLSDALQEAIKVGVGTHRKPPRRLKSFLNGTWFGHPLHPVLTDVLIAAWLLTAIFDIIWLIAHTHASWAGLGAFVAIIVGLLGAMATGLTDWSDTYGAERRVGLNHAFFNACAFVLYLVSFILRWLPGPGDGIAAAILGFVGLVCVCYAGYLGGELLFTTGTGVNHSAWEATGADYEAVLPVEQVEEHKLYRVTASGVPVVVLRQGEQYFAISATCSHAGGPLDKGTLTGDVVECPWHGSRFCLRDGRVRGAFVEVKRGCQN